MRRGAKAKRSFYEVLGISEDANASQIRAAYRRLAMKFHPDKNPDDAEFATEKFKEVSEAYETLSDPGKRAEYDSRGGMMDSDGLGFDRRASHGTGRREFGYDRASEVFAKFFSAFSTEFGDDEFFSDTFSRGMGGSLDDFHRSFMDESSWNDRGRGRRAPSTLDSMFADMSSRIGMDSFHDSSHRSAVTSSSMFPRGFDMGGMTGGTSRTVSSTTRIVNGRRVTKTTETIVHADGSSETTSHEAVEDSHEDLPRLRGMR